MEIWFLLVSDGICDVGVDIQVSLSGIETWNTICVVYGFDGYPCSVYSSLQTRSDVYVFDSGDGDANALIDDRLHRHCTPPSFVAFLVYYLDPWNHPSGAYEILNVPQ